MRFQIIKSDKRFEFLNDIFMNNGIGSSLIEKVDDISCKNLILPIPVTRDGVKISGTEIKIKDLTSHIQENSTIFCGKKELLNSEITKFKNIKILDYSDNELFLLKNAELTSYGILKILFEQSKKAPNKLKILISGFGRIGKILSQMLLNLNIQVHVLGHNLKDKFWIKKIGAKELKSLENLRFDFIINTAPSMIFSEDIIKNIKFETSFIEVASKNGIDKNACKKFEIKYQLSLGIPGKYFPKESAEVIKESIFNLIGEK